MKKIFQIATVACAALAIASCQTKLNEPVAPAEEIAAGYHMATLRAGHPASKAVMNGDASVTWQADDFVYVARSGEVIKFVPSDASEGYEKEFHAPVADGETYTAAIYNRFGAVSAFDGSAFTTVIPSAQNGESGNLIAVGSKADVLDGSAVGLEMVTSGFRFTVGADLGITSVTVTVLDGTDPMAIAGNVTVATDGTVSGADAKSVTVSKAFASGDVVYIATAPLASNKVRLSFMGTQAGEPYNYVKTAELTGDFSGAKGCINDLGTISSFSGFTNTIITVDTQSGQAGKTDAEETAVQTTIEVNVAETVSCVLNDNTKQDAVINVSDIAEGAVLVVDSDSDYQGKTDPTVTINLPSGTPADAFEGLVINAPNAHVTVMVDGVAVDPATYFKNVTTSTADSTLVIEDGITIDNLTVLKGSVYVVYGATVGNIVLGENAGLVKVEYYSNIEGVKRNGVDTYAGVVVNEWIDLYSSDLITNEEQLLAAVAEADVEKVYKVGADFTVTSAVEIPQDFTLDLNGYTITNMVSSNRMFRVGDATLTIHGNGGALVIPDDFIESYGFVDMRLLSGEAFYHAGCKLDHLYMIGATAGGSFVKARNHYQEFEFSYLDVDCNKGTGEVFDGNAHGDNCSILNCYGFQVCKVDIIGGTYRYASRLKNMGVFQDYYNAFSTFDKVTVISAEGPVNQGMAYSCTITDCNFANPSDVDANSWTNTAICTSNSKTVDVYGGYYEGNYAAYVYSSGGVINIYGGTFIGSKNVLMTSYSAGYDEGQDFAINVYDGKIKGTIKEVAHTEVTLYGGVYSEDPSAYVAPEYKVIGNNDVEYPYAVVSAYVQVTNRAELEAALAAGETLIDFVGESFDVTSQIVANISDDVTIKGLKFRLTSGQTGLLVEAGNNTLTLKDAELESVSTTNNARIINLNSGSLALKDCELNVSTLKSGTRAMRANWGTSLNVDGCTITGAWTASADDLKAGEVSYAGSQTQGIGVGGDMVLTNSTISGFHYAIRT
ncbi:MAG: hypothetical protein IJS66_05145 [Bacteroidales bacterium]|nr:hypothetical protein [Bacteroidales bacterium]